MLACQLLLLAGLLMMGGQATQPATPAGSSATQPALTLPATAIPGVPLNANVAIIPIHGQIADSTYDHLKYRLDASVSNGATMVVIELDTPGGDMWAAIRISKLLRGANVPTLAWVNNTAYSAGILIASACDAIVMSPASTTGDCAPIRIENGQVVTLGPTERAKLLSPLLDEFNENAKTHGYDQAIFQAMCILNARVYEVRRNDTGEIRFINQDDLRVMVDGEDFDKVASEMAGEDKLVGLSMTLASPQEQGKWSQVRLVHDGKTLLTVSDTQAQAIGLSKAQVGTVNQLQQTLSANQVSILPVTWTQTVAYWLSRHWVRAILVVVMLLAAYMEMQTPGMGIGGGIALVALILLVGGPMLVGIAQWWHLLLVLLGVGLLAVELFVTPGLGFVGAGGLMAMFIGLTLMSVPTSSGAFQQPPTVTAERLQSAAMWMLVAIIISGVGFAVLTYYFGQLPFMNRLTLSASQAASTGAAGEQGVAVAPAQPVAGLEAVGHGQVAVGQTGVALAALRPAGRVRIGQQVVDVISDGQWIEAGQAVRVIESRGSRIVVQRDA